MVLVPIDDDFLRPASSSPVTAVFIDTGNKRFLGFARSVKWVEMRDVERVLEEDSDNGSPLGVPKRIYFFVDRQHGLTGPFADQAVNAVSIKIKIKQSIFVSYLLQVCSSKTSDVAMAL